MRPRTGCVLVRQTFCLPHALTASIGCSLNRPGFDGVALLESDMPLSHQHTEDIHFLDDRGEHLFPHIPDQNVSRCPTKQAQVPPARGGKKTRAAVEYEILVKHPYSHTEE